MSKHFIFFTSNYQFYARNQGFATFSIDGQIYFIFGGYMNRLTIVMNNDRSLTQDTYSLGVERDNKIDELALITPKTWNGLDMFNSVVSLHLKAEDNYFYNTVCDNKHIDGDFAVFLFPVTREMTSRNGKVKLEFAFENSAFCFTSRSIELTVNKSLTDGEEIESDYPGILVDVLNSVEGFTKRLDDADSLIATIDDDVDVLFNKAERIDSSLGKIEAFLGYDDEDIIGLEADFENSTFTRLAGAKGLSAGADFDSFPMYQRRRCNVSDDGTIVAYYGDEGYRDDGTNGQVMVYQPAFYYRVVPTKLEKQEGGLGYHIRKANYYVSSKPKPFFKLHPAFYDANGNPVPYVLYSAYEGSVWDVSEGCYISRAATSSEDLLCSVAGVKPFASSSDMFELMAKNRGEGWHLETIKTFSATQLLMIIEFATLNMQEAVGKGVVGFATNTTVNCASLTGSTAILGNGTGSASETVNENGGVETTHTEAGKVSISYRGVENVWGNIWKHINGINVWGDGSMLGGQAYIASDFSFNGSKRDGNYEPVGFTVANSSAYIGAMGYGNEDFDWLFVPSQTGGTNQYPVGDYIYSNRPLNGYRGTELGGAWGYGVNAGLFCYMLGYAPGASAVFFGGRMVHVPTAK